MIAALRALGSVPFPLESRDVRGLMAAHAADQWRLYVKMTSADMRRWAAPMVSAGARKLADLLIEQGAAQAAAWRAATGQRDD